MTVEKLDIGSGDFIAYHHQNGKQNTPGIVFLGGLMSDMQGTKALYLEEFCQSQNLSYTRFDYLGHGQSSRKFTECTIGMWKDNALTIFDKITKGSQIIIGSSLGGWLMLLLALARPERVQALIGIASAPDFTTELIWPSMSKQEQENIAKTGIYQKPSPYSDEPYPVTHELMEESKQNLVFDKPNIAINCPVRLLHGMKDDDVPYELSVKLASKLDSEDVEVQLIKQGDHRMSSEYDLKQLSNTLETLLTKF